jgi:RNA polymerase sigma factor (sigma-70 family)
MKSFGKFLSEEYLALESLMQIDRTLFKNITDGKYALTAEQIEKYDLERSLIKEDDEKQYLENAEEVKLIQKYQDDPNSQEGMDALNKLVENKMPYIYSKVEKHLITHPQQRVHKEDLVQEASLALVKAIEKFDIGSGNIFNAFAKKYITTAILNAFNPLRHKVDTLQTVSIDAPVSGSRGEWADKDTTVGDSIPDENSTLPWESGQSEDEERALLKDWLKRLPETEAKAIEMYFPANNEDKKTLEEIGAELKMTKMGVKKLIDRVVNKLKQFAKEEGIVDSDK